MAAPYDRRCCSRGLALPPVRSHRRARSAGRLRVAWQAARRRRTAGPTMVQSRGYRKSCSLINVENAGHVGSGRPTKAGVAVVGGCSASPMDTREERYRRQRWPLSLESVCMPVSRYFGRRSRCGTAIEPEPLGRGGVLCGCGRQSPSTRADLHLLSAVATASSRALVRTERSRSRSPARELISQPRSGLDSWPLQRRLQYAPEHMRRRKRDLRRPGQLADDGQSKTLCLRPTWGRRAGVTSTSHAVVEAYRLRAQ